MRGGTRKGAGRKPGSAKETKRDTVKQIRWTAEEWQRVETAAQKARQTPSEYIRESVAKYEQNKMFVKGYLAALHDARLAAHVLNIPAVLHNSDYNMTRAARAAARAIEVDIEHLKLKVGITPLVVQTT